MEFTTAGVTFAPVLPKECTEVQLTHLPYRAMTLHIRVKGQGTRVSAMTINGKETERPFLPAGGKGKTEIAIRLTE